MTAYESSAVAAVRPARADRDVGTMELKPLDAGDPERVADWLARKENYQWLHFGPGRQTLDALTLKVMDRRDQHLLRLFTPGSGHGPVGLVALSDIDRRFGTAGVWYVLGEKDQGRKGYTTRAVSRLLDLAFGKLGLGAVHAWTVETNEPSQRLLMRLGFRLCGRKRCCHRIEGVTYDRLLFDLLAEEHERRPVPP